MKGLNMAKEEKIDLDAFFEEMVSLVNERLKKQELVIGNLRKDVNKLKNSISLLNRSSSLKIDKSVLKILKGK